MGIQTPTLKQKIKRWWDTRIKGLVTLTTISRDEETGGYRMDTILMERAEIPVEAVHNTGDPYGYTIDKIAVRHPFRTDENGFTAIDLNLWLESNDINDCLAFKWEGFEKQIDSKMILIIGGILLAGVVIWYVLKGGF